MPFGEEFLEQSNNTTEQFQQTSFENTENQNTENQVNQTEFENTNTDENDFYNAIDFDFDENEFDVDLDENTAFDFLKKSKGLEVDSLEDFLKGRETIKEVNPYEAFLDEEDKQYLNYKKETGRSRKDFEFLNQDFDKLNPFDLAKQRIEKETGLPFTKEQAKEYLEEKFDIDLSDEELSIKARIELNSYIKPVKEELLALKEKYKQPIENRNTQSQNHNQEEIVKLSDGSMMKKEDYQALQENHQKHIQNAIASVDSVTGASFETVFDDNGTEKKLNYSYDYSNEDKQSMLSVVKNVDAEMESRYRSENGDFNHKQFAEDLFWSDPKNRGKVITSLINKARAEAIEELMKSDSNINFSPKTIPKSNTKNVTTQQTTNGFGFNSNFLTT